MNAAALAAPRTVADLDWEAMARDLDERGFAVTPTIVAPAACRRLRRSFDDGTARFRATVDMARYNFGQGRYRYFDYPLPDVVDALRQAFYPHLAAIANTWRERLGQPADWPTSLRDLTARCHAQGQSRPTPLLLRYQAGDYNCLHQDLYGPIHFPLQVVVLLSRPVDEFHGGELILVEQRPRMQSRPLVVPLLQGQAAIIPVRERPRLGTRGWHRTQMRHGVATVTAGCRSTLGLIFHDAR